MCRGTSSSRADVNISKTRLKRNISPLYIALQKGDAQMTELLLRTGADVNESHELLYLVLTGSTAGHAQCLRLPITFGRNMNLNHTSVLTIATRDEVKVQLLIEGGADVNLRDGQGPTALHTAASAGNDPSLKLLVETGAGVNTTDATGAMHAARAGKHTSVKMLIEAGAHVNIVNHHGETAMMHAMTYQPSLFGLFADPSYCIGGPEECIKLLLAEGANVNAADNQGFTPTTRTAQICNVECLKILIASGADVNAVDNTREDTSDVC